MIEVILVDEHDQQIGTMEKLIAHQEGKLHRAVSVFIFNSNGKWLLQQRARNKYHSGGLWSNTACSHPRVGESNEEAALRCLREEMGLSAKLYEVFSFVYYEPVGNQLVEHEYDHVFIGVTDDLPTPKADEVMDYAYLTYDDLQKVVNEKAENFTIWFRHLFEKVAFHYQQLKNEGLV